MWVVISKDYYPELEHTKPEQQLTEVTMVPCKMVSTSTIQVKKGNDDLMSSHAGLKNWATDGWGLQQGGGLSLERWSCFKSSWQCGVGPLTTGLQIFFFFFLGWDLWYSGGWDSKTAWILVVNFFFNGWVIVGWPQWFYRWDQMSDRNRYFYYSRLTGSDTSNGSEFALIPNLTWTNQNITTRKLKNKKNKDRWPKNRLLGLLGVSSKQ